jgi:pimeloyl-ACP methyl ester carboxylesterase
LKERTDQQALLFYDCKFFIMQKNIFRLTILIILGSAVMVMITPSLTLNSMLYPPRIDSSYWAQAELMNSLELEKGKGDTEKVFMFTPLEAGLKYDSITHTTADGTLIRGWLSYDTTRSKAPLLLIIPDISQGAIQFLPSMMKFTKRGFHVLLMDMRGQGRSEGLLYHPGYSAGDVISLLTEVKKSPVIEKVAILGIGTGAGITIATVTLAPFIVDVIVLQNPSVSLGRRIRQQSIDEWGWMINPFLPAIVRAYEYKTGINTSDFDYIKMISAMSIPQMYVAASYKSIHEHNQTIALYRVSDYFRKRLYIERESLGLEAGVPNSKEYYDKISAFINSSFPGNFKRFRTGKLVEVRGKW